MRSSIEVQDWKELEDVIPRVELVPVYIPYGVKFVNTGEFYAIKRLGTTFVYSIVSKRYVLVEHYDIVKAVEKILEDYGYEPHMRIARLGDKNVKTFFYDVILKDTKVNGDRLLFGLRVRSSYDGNSAIHLNGMGIRDVCSNLMVFGSNLMQEHVIHLGKPYEKLLEKSLPKLVESLTGVIDHIKAAMENKISPKEFLDFVDSISKSKKMRETILLYVKYEVGKSFTYLLEKEEEMRRWDAYNVLTRALTHYNGNISQATIHELNKKASRILVAPKVVSQ